MIRLRDIIDEYALDRKQLAVELFPEAKHPDLALARIMDYCLELDLKQICTIARMASCNPIDLATTLIQSSKQ